MRIAVLGDGSLDHVRRWSGYFHRRGHAVLLLSFEDVSGSSFPAERLPRLLPTKLLGYTAALGVVRRRLRRFKPDVVSAVYAAGYGFIGALCGQRPLVVSAIGSDLLVNYPACAVHRFQIRRALGAADLITTDAAVLSRAAVAAGARRERILEMVFGIDEAIFHPGAGGSPEFPVIASTRNLYPVYDVATLLEAAARPSFPAGGRVVICGDGPQRGALEARCAALGISSRVTFTGQLAAQEIAAVLRGAGLYVSASLSDSTSVSLLEAMACGAVPVVTDIEANREWIRDGENGLLFPPGDARALAEAIARASGDVALAGSARRANFALVRERGLWHDNMARVESALEALAARAGGG